MAQRLRAVRGLGPKFEAEHARGDRRAAPASGGAARCCCRERDRDRRGARRRTGELGGAETHVQLAGSAAPAGRHRQGSRPDRHDHPSARHWPRASAGSSEIESVGSASRSGARGRTHTGMAVDLRIAKPSQLGNLLQHFTGSGPHNAALRERAVRRGLHVSEHGVLDDATGSARTAPNERGALRAARPLLHRARAAREPRRARGGAERDGCPRW